MEVDAESLGPSTALEEVHLGNYVHLGSKIIDDASVAPIVTSNGPEGGEVFVNGTEKTLFQMSV